MQPSSEPSRAWQPLTPRGAAAFARASLRRLWLVQFLFAALTAGLVIWFLEARWFPVVRSAIVHLPPEGEIRAGTLSWTGNPSQRLAESSFLALAVDLDHEGKARSPTQLQIEFGRRDIRVSSLAGYTSILYPATRVISFNRPELEPKWGAWAPEILAFAGAGVVIFLMLVWAILAALYFFPIRLIAFFADRDVTLAGSWRLAGACLMPGALLMDAAVAGYAFGALDLVHLVAAFGLHFVVGWVYLFWSPFMLQRQPGVGVASVNPFAPAGDGRKKEAP